MRNILFIVSIKLFPLRDPAILCRKHKGARRRDAEKSHMTGTTSRRIVLRASDLSRVAGTETRTVVGYGYTEEEAYRNAMREDENYHGHEEGYGGGAGSVRQVLRRKMLEAPKLAKRVTVEKQVIQRGPVRKAYGLGISGRMQDRVERGAASNRIYNERAFNDNYHTQGEAMRAARDLALKHNMPVEVSLKAVFPGNTLLAVVTPEESKPGKWAFECDFRS